VDKLRKFVNTRFSDNPSYSGYTFISFRYLFQIGERIGFHGAEFIAVKLLIIETVPFLLEKHRTFGFKLDDETENWCEPGQNSDNDKKRYHNIEGSLDKIIKRIIHRYFA